MVPRLHLRRLCLVTLVGALLILDLTFISLDNREHPHHGEVVQTTIRVITPMLISFWLHYQHFRSNVGNRIYSNHMQNMIITREIISYLLPANLRAKNRQNDMPSRHVIVDSREVGPIIYLRDLTVPNDHDEKTPREQLMMQMPSHHDQNVANIKMFLHSTIATCDRLNDGVDNPTLVCVDEELGVIAQPQLNFQNTSSKIKAQDYKAGCLVLSFGVQYDTSFDKEVAELPCELHMFDIIDFKPGIVDLYDYVHFHQHGLSEAKRMGGFIHAYTGGVFYTPVNTLHGLMARLGLQKRLLHVLKIDIEGNEWDVLEQLSQDLILDQVGQINYFFPFNILNTPNLNISHGLELYEILKPLNYRGFRLVSFWDNIQDQYAYHSSAGCRYETSGEVLYVNTNWYNATFKSRQRNQGYEP
ncbi:unnamed protein product, partial [Meganyctiphanes norvegica]